MSNKDDDDEFSGSDKDKKWWSEAVRDLSSAGLAALFMTEDSVRNYLREKKFPKEVVGQLLDGVSKKKEDVYSMIAKEVGSVLSKMDLTGELGKFLENHQIHLEAKLSFEPKKKTAHHKESHAKDSSKHKQES